jgi:hypothetical protein
MSATSEERPAGGDSGLGANILETVGSPSSSAA